ncbi:hypothetical protein CFC21_107834 [Triticum aestivum]|uniref:Leucine-rich repeat-containing N-terminal plant-type domain-containing protein n=2 Tax=Triticum aestivum TaxID=4565 RepID=A0A9R1NAU9_WHEAT|nr:hypothetical protein CFC21_107834 [Triticum aestivum]
MGRLRLGAPLSIADAAGCASRHGFEIWSKLTKLKVLDLSGNMLNDSIITSLVALSTIRSLFLNYTALSSAVTIQQLSTMKLETLDLSDNAINGTISTGICNMEILQELHLNDNMLFGELPSCIGNLTSLRVLDLSNNLLRVKLPSPSFAKFTSLVKLSLSNNHLEGVLFLSSLSNNRQLTHLELASSGNDFQLQTENPATDMSAQLQVLVLRNCNLNGNSAVIPRFLLHQHSLDLIDMSNNNLGGYFPSWLIENNVNLSYLILRGNSFSGPLFPPPKVHINLQWLDASCNKLSKLTMEINVSLPNLQYLNLSDNSFQGVFPSSFNNMVSRVGVDLSSNNFLDDIGAAFKMIGIANLILSRNNFYGSLPQELPPHFSHLVLNDNKITGKIPESICFNIFLTVLDFSNNNLIGSLPTCIYALPLLVILNLKGNSLVGSIPSEICHLNRLIFLDVSRNNLSGPIPCLPNVQYLHLSENQFNGTFPLSLGTDIYTIDLQGNQFSGILPRLMFKAFPKLQIMLLERNMFEGMIPNDICHLKCLRLLDLSHNKLSGKLPSCLSNIGSDDESFNFQYSDRNITSIFLMFPVSSYQDLLAQYTKFISQPDQEEFMTKSRKDYYKGNMLNYMSGLDFSSNQLKGSIPESIGDMKWLRALNFSANYFDGSIPQSLSNLSDLESLDLSHNNLAGQIPSELAALRSLEVFSVAYNNLSGPTPGIKGQFITFDQSSYEGNPYLCGPPLLSCSEAPSVPELEENKEDDKVDDIILFGCSAMFYMVGFWTSMGVLYFKTSWRWSWFSVVDRFSDCVMAKLAIYTRKIRGAN